MYVLRYFKATDYGYGLQPPYKVFLPSATASATAKKAEDFPPTATALATAKKVTYGRPLAL